MLFFVFKQKTAYEMRISDWSSDVCSSDLGERVFFNRIKGHQRLVTQDSFNFFTLLNDSALGFYLRRYFRRRVLVLKKSRCWRGIDRKSVVSGKIVSVRVDLGGRRIVKKNKRIESTLIKK